MSWTKEATIWCDEDECVEYFRNGIGSVTETRRYAKSDGWSHEDGEDYCPEHG